MKPRHWDAMSPRAKQEFAGSLLNSLRGQLIMGQALVRATELMRMEERPETSNIQDMEIIQEVCFPLFGAIRQAEADFARHRARATAANEA